MKRILLYCCLMMVLFGCNAAEPPAAVDRPETAVKPLEIWFIRHAESEINVLDLDEISNVVPDEGVTYPLTRNGIEQAVQLAQALENEPLIAIYSSTRLRTLQTADAIAFKHGMPLRLASEIVELDIGIEEMVNPEDFFRTLVDISQRWVAGRDRDQPLGTGGESYHELESRFMPFWERLVSKHGNESGVIAVVTHGALMVFMLPEICATTLTGDTTFRHQPHNTGIVKGELRDGVLHCTQWMDIDLRGQ